MAKQLAYNIRDIELPIKISASKINLFSDCPVKYFFRYRTDISIQQTIWPGNLFGQTCHRILEYSIDQLNKNVSHEEIIRNIKGMFETTFFKLREEHKKFWKESRSYVEEDFLRKGEKFANILIKFILQFFPLGYTTLLSEKKFQKHWIDDEILITGIIDAMIFIGDEFKIYDLKVTSENEQYYYVNWNENVQSVIYQYLTEKEYGVLSESFGFIVMNHEEKTLFYKEKIIEKNDRNYSYIDNIIGIMKKFIFDTKDSINKHYKCNNYYVCKWCEYKKLCELI